MELNCTFEVLFLIMFDFKEMNLDLSNSIAPPSKVDKFSVNILFIMERCSAYKVLIAPPEVALFLKNTDFSITTYFDSATNKPPPYLSEHVLFEEI